MQQEDSVMARDDNVPSWRACDNCRNRKVKCDKRSPCSNCRASNLACRTASRPKEQRQRILISDQYERKVEIIEERLARIESLLENLTALSTTFQQRPSIPEHTPRIALAPAAAETTQTTPFASSITPKIEKIPEVNAPSPLQTTPRSGNGDVQKASSSSNNSGDNAGAAFEGASSLSAHSVHATRIFENAMSNDYAVFGRNPEMQDALFALRNLIEKQQQHQQASPANHEYRFPNQQGDASSVDFSSAKMPRLESVVSFLRLSKEYHNFLDHPFIDFEQFNELCRKVYFATEDYSLGTFALVNGGLFYLFKEIAFVQGKNVPEAAENAALCRANLEYAISHFNIFMAPTNENLQALLLGASYAIDISQPSLCWALTSTAARVCQTLGYHRSVDTPGDNSNNQHETNLKKRMFWFTYILDKSLSLRLGHSSILQDFDITLPLSDLSDSDSQMNMWDTLYHHWIKIGYFQGRIYEELYSPRALSGLATDRTQRAKQLAADMRQWYQDTRLQLVPPSRAYNPLYYEAAASSSEIMYYGLSTLAYRAMPPGPLDSSTIFSNECIETARAALRAHQENTERYKHTNSHIWHGYISWVLINCPFTPFMVLFCHAIATANLSDLKCLGDFASSLQTSGESVEAAEKLWRLCHVFHRVAELYIQAKLMQQQQQQQQQNGQFLHLDGNNNAIPSPSAASASAAAGLNVPNMSTEENNNAFKYTPPFPIDDFEPYLSALGFPNAAGFLNIQQQQQQQPPPPPPPQHQHQQQQQTTTLAAAAAAAEGGEFPTTLEPGLGTGGNGNGNAAGAGDANSLENWFTGNVNIMSLLEMDLSSIIK